MQIRSEQLVLMAAARHRELRPARIARVLELTADGDEAEAGQLVDAAVAAAVRYGLEADDDVWRVIALALEAGTDWTLPERRWMDAMLTDPRVTPARARLTRVEAEWKRRKWIAEANKQSVANFRKGAGG